MKFYFYTCALKLRKIDFLGAYFWLNSKLSSFRREGGGFVRGVLLTTALVATALIPVRRRAPSADLNILRSAHTRFADLNTAKKIWLDIAYPPGEWSWRIFGSKKCQHFPGKSGFPSGASSNWTLHVLNLRSTFKVHTPVFCGP